ncbi:MAG: urea transport system substrate-binding protein [Solirubrobacteraceae bacterium]|nr:urea transport system substrate-binding protein [Solirubrobacteraceae bacterium]
MTDVTRRALLRRGGAGTLALGLGGGLLSACGGESNGGGSSGGGGGGGDDSGPIKIGLLSALSGVLSITEKSIHDGAALAVEEVNAAGGVNGRKLQPISEDYASDFTIAVQKAQKLITQDKAAVVVGGYTSASRVAVIPTFQKSKALFLYGTFYEGLECDVNTFYTGAVPNQLLIDYVPWVMQNLGKSFYIVGSDYIYPRTVSAIVQKLVKASGGTIVSDRYFQLGTTEFGSVISDIQAKKPDVVFSNLVGDSIPAFYKQYKSAGLTADKNPIAATVTTEVEVQAMGPGNADGHFMSGTYFQSLDNPANKKFVAAYKEKYGADTVTHMPLANTYNAVWLFAKAAAKTPDDLSMEPLSKALVGSTYDQNPEGEPTTIDANHHCNHPSYVGQCGSDGQYKVVETFKPRPADPFPAEVVPASKRPKCPVAFSG